MVDRRLPSFLSAAKLRLSRKLLSLWWPDTWAPNAGRNQVWFTESAYISEGAGRGWLLQLARSDFFSALRVSCDLLRKRLCSARYLSHLRLSLPLICISALNLMRPRYRPRRKRYASMDREDREWVASSLTRIRWTRGLDRVLSVFFFFYGFRARHIL